MSKQSIIFMLSVFFIVFGGFGLSLYFSLKNPKK